MMHNQELYVIAEQENFTIIDVVTILQFSLIFDKNNNLREKHAGSLLIDLWHAIPNKKNCLAMYKEQMELNKQEMDNSVGSSAP